MRQPLFSCIGWRMVYLFRFLLDKARRREVTVAVIRQEGYDGLAGVFRTFCDFRSGIESCTAGDTDEEAFGFGEFLSRFISLFCRNREDFVVDLGIQCFRNEVCADALEFVRACMAFGEERRIFRFDSDDLDGRFLFFEVLADAGERAACADTS